MSHYASHHNMTTDRWSGFERTRVDSAQTSFFEGREFRTFYEFAIPAGQSVVLKFTAAVPFVLFSQDLKVDGGGVRLLSHTVGTEGLPFTLALPVIGKNRMPERRAPYYEAQNTVHSGGTHTGGILTDVHRVFASGTGSHQSTIGGQQSSERGLGAGAYYLTLESISNVEATGVYALWWEERARHPEWKFGSADGT